MVELDETDAIIAYQVIRIVPVDTNGMRWYHGIPIFPPFLPPLSPTTPITPYNPPNIFRAPPFPPRVFSASAGVICAGAR